MMIARIFYSCKISMCIPNNIISILLIFLTNFDLLEEKEDILCTVDRNKQNFLHHVASQSSNQLKEVLSRLPKEVAAVLAVMEDSSRKTPKDLAKGRMRQEYLDQAGSYPVDFYHLPHFPLVLIFYTTVHRLSEETFEGKIYDALEEKQNVEKYFIERSIRFKSFRDSTSSDLQSNIRAAAEIPHLSGLVVFIMCHGAEGVVTLADQDRPLEINKIMNYMCHPESAGKPKVRQSLKLQVRKAVETGRYEKILISV